jgi:hypothetical protein
MPLEMLPAVEALAAILDLAHVNAIRAYMRAGVDVVGDGRVYRGQLGGHPTTTAFLGKVGDGNGWRGAGPWTTTVREGQRASIEEGVLSGGCYPCGLFGWRGMEIGRRRSLRRREGGRLVVRFGIRPILAAFGRFLVRVDVSGAFVGGLERQYSIVCPTRGWKAGSLGACAGSVCLCICTDLADAFLGFLGIRGKRFLVDVSTQGILSHTIERFHTHIRCEARRGIVVRMDALCVRVIHLSDLVDESHGYCAVVMQR